MNHQFCFSKDYSINSHQKKTAGSAVILNHDQ